MNVSSGSNSSKQLYDLDIEKQRDKETKRQRPTDTQTHRHTDTHKHTYTDTGTDTHAHTWIHMMPGMIGTLMPLFRHSLTNVS